MAIITNSPIVSEIRGSSGGQTFSRNKYRAYVKIRKAPTDTITPYKTTARNNFASAALGWSALTDAQRLAWNKAAFDFTTKARLGVEPVSDGFNYFVRFNMYLLMAGQSMVDTPGHDRNMPYLRTFIPDAFTSAIGFDYVVSFTSSDFIMYGYTSPPVSPGRMSVNSTQLLFLSAQAVFSGSSVFDMTTEWFDRFGDPSDYVGKKVFFGARIMSLSQGSLTPMRIHSAIIS